MSSVNTSSSGEGPVTVGLRDVLARVADDRSGEPLAKIPELASVDPDQLGVALASIDGHVYAAGDADVAFTIQSISKAFVFALALEELGTDAVLEHVGVEPSGEAFDAISLHPETGYPANPMINAGALVVTSLIDADHPADRFAQIRQRLSGFAGRELEVDEAVYRSELAAASRNRGLAHLMKHAGALQASVDDVIEAYSRQCSILVTARDLAMMAATLAAHGVNPVTGERVVSAQTARGTMSAMATCGMYDASGRWLFRVGMPAKSGVGGGVIAVSAGGFGVGVFSPRLDPLGNSVRGVAAVRALSEYFELHLLDQPAQTAPVVSYDERHQLPGGDELVVLAAQGELSFVESERLSWTIRAAKPRALVLDLSEVTQVHTVAGRLLEILLDALVTRGVTVTLIHTERIHGKLACTGRASSREAAVAALTG